MPIKYVNLTEKCSIIVVDGDLQTVLLSPLPPRSHKINLETFSQLVFTSSSYNFKIVNKNIIKFSFNFMLIYIFYRRTKRELIHFNHELNNPFRELFLYF